MAINNTRIAPATDSTGADIGNGLFATTHVNKGSDILTVDTPFVAVLEEKLLKRVCSGCFDTPRPGKIESHEPGLVKACVRCKVVSYCDKTCQLHDWKQGHALECAIYARLAPRVLPLNVRAVLRVLLRQQQRSGKTTATEPGAYESFLELCFPDAEHQRDGLDLFLLAKAVQEYGGLQGLDQGFIAEVFGRVDLNSFTLTSAFGNTRGVYLHPYTARFNHSCDYNATYSFGRGGKCYVKAIRAIRKDEQVFVPYTDSTFSVGTRRRELYERFKFECKCSRCVREISTTSAAEVKARAAEEEEVNKAVDAIFKDSEKREDAGLALTTTRRLTSLLSSTAAKHDWDIVSRQRQPLASIRIDLMGAQILANKWKDLTLNAAIQHLRIDPDVYPDETHPVRRTNAFAFAQYAFYMLEGYRVRAGEDEGDDVMMRAEMNLGVLVWSIMSWVVRGRRYYSMPEYENASRRKAQKKNGNAKSIERAEDIIWPNPTFREEAVRFFGLVTRYCEEDGFERGMEMDNVIWRNWSSLERIIDSALEDEMGLPMTITTDESDL